jgi:hypothetical protein
MADGAGSEQPSYELDLTTPLLDLPTTDVDLDDDVEASGGHQPNVSRALRIAGAGLLGLLVWVGSGLLADGESNDVETSAPELSANTSTSVPSADPEPELDAARPLSNPNFVLDLGAGADAAAASGSSTTAADGSTTSSATAPSSTEADAAGTQPASSAAPATTGAPATTDAPATTGGTDSPTTSGTDAAGSNAGSDTTSGSDSGGNGSGGSAPAPVPAAATNGDYQTNLAMIQASSARNTNHDASPYRNTPSASLNPSDLYGPRSEYLGNPGGNPEQSFPVGNGGQFRTACEFSHFAYDDPLLYPNQPGAAHLHMFFGNTDVNAFSTYDTLLNSGSSTCNGMELNRTGYWVPAIIDGNGNVRVPERVVVYYKGEGLARGNSEVYPEGAAFIATENYNALPESQGGVPGKFSFVCSDVYSSNGGTSSQTMPTCYGSNTAVLEMNVKFPQCWNGQDPSDWNNYRTPDIGWYSSLCRGEHNRTLPNLEYFVNYRVEAGEDTSSWFLSSDVEASSFGASKVTAGSTIHGDWWGAWHRQTNQMWIDNCVNYQSGSASGCGFGYLSDGGPNGSAPYDGPALKLRPQYTGPNKVSASELLSDLCPNPRRAYSKPEDAAYCTPS